MRIKRERSYFGQSGKGVSQPPNLDLREVFTDFKNLFRQAGNVSLLMAVLFHLEGLQISSRGEREGDKEEKKGRILCGNMMQNRFTSIKKTLSTAYI